MEESAEYDKDSRIDNSLITKSISIRQVANGFILMHFSAPKDSLMPIRMSGEEYVYTKIDELERAIEKIFSKE